MEYNRIPEILNFLSVSQIAWSVDATNVVAAHLGGDISVKRVVDSPAGDNGTAHLKSLATPKVDLDGRGINQMLLNAGSTVLFIVNEGRGQIWSLDEEAVIATLFDQDMNRRWLQYPTQKSILLGFGAIDIRVFRRQNFSEQSCLYFYEDRSRIESHTKLDSTGQHTIDLAKLSLGTDTRRGLNCVVNKAMLTQDSRHILVQIKSTSGQGQIFKQLLIFDISSFVPDGEQDAASTQLSYAYIPPDILSRIEVPLGILSGSRLTFLDQDLWFCTFRLESTHDHDDHGDDNEALQ